MGMKFLMIMVSVGLLLGAHRAKAQPSPNTVNQLILNADTSSSGHIAIKASNNIGQNSHQVFAYTSDVSGQTCGTSFVSSGSSVSLSGSLDNVTYKQISPTVAQSLTTSATTDIYPLLAFASGVYPYLRVDYTNGSPTTCQLTVWYTGSISPQAYSGSPRTVNDQFSFIPISVSAQGDNTLTSGCQGTSAVGGGVLALYELYLYNPNAANTTIVKLATTGSTYAAYLTLTNFQQFAQFSGMPFTGKPHYIAYATTLAGQNIVINLANATAVTGFAAYRCE